MIEVLSAGASRLVNLKNLKTESRPQCVSSVTQTQSVENIRWQCRGGGEGFSISSTHQHPSSFRRNTNLHTSYGLWCCLLCGCAHIILNIYGSVTFRLTRIHSCRWRIVVPIAAFLLVSSVVGEVNCKQLWRNPLASCCPLVAGCGPAPALDWTNNNNNKSQMSVCLSIWLKKTSADFQKTKNSSCD